jgi:hypothetical protein
VPKQADSDSEEIFQLEKRAFFSRVSCEMRRTKVDLRESIDKCTDMVVRLPPKQIREAWGLPCV